MTTTTAPTAYRYSVGIDGRGFCRTDRLEVVERTIEKALRTGRNDSVEVVDLETGETTVYRVERRISVERRSAPRGEDRRRS